MGLICIFHTKKENPENGALFRLSKNLYNEKGRPPYPYKSAKSRDLCVAFCTSQGRLAPLVRWPDGHTLFGPVSGRPYFLCFSAYNRPGAGAQYGSGGTPPAPCKNSKKWLKPLFRHARIPGAGLRRGLLFHSGLETVYKSRFWISTAGGSGWWEPGCSSQRRGCWPGWFRRA